MSSATSTGPEGVATAPWGDPAVVSLGREPMLPAGWVPCADLRGARSGRPAPERSRWVIDLDGQWDIELLASPGELTIGHLCDAELASTVTVPGAWTMQRDANPQWPGPIYTNVVMPFGGEPPSVPQDNPTAVHRRTIEVPESWDRRRIVVRVGSAESVVMVFLDGEFVGYGTDSRLPSDFDITSRCRAGSSHQLALVVPRWSAQTWLEDQDQWFHGGLQRSVCAYSTAPTHISSAQLRAHLAPPDFPLRADEPTTGSVEVDVLVQGPGCTEPGWTVEVRVEPLRGAALATTGRLEVPHWNDSGMLELNAGAMFTEAGRVRSTLEVPGVLPWSAESPRLYRLLVVLRSPDGSLVEAGSLRSGFRSTEVRDRQLLINGAPVVLRGVNLHEHHPRKGRAVSREDARAELLMLKAANLNAVRAAHYPHAEHFAELCDELGLYLVDEANVESHARQWSLCHDRRFDASVLARVSRMVERDMHHPSVVMWSLGNEAGYGAAFDAAAAWVRSVDDTRPLHYEQPFMFDLHAEAPVSDVVCPMYSTVEEILDWAADDRDTRRPLVLCEYSHAMGNACGGLVDYDDAFEHTPGLQGGFIWEWCEHGIPEPSGATGPTGSPSWAYGGDFGDDPADGNFVLDGLVGADRAPHPVLDELRYLGRPVRARLIEAGPGRAEVELTNQGWFTDTSALRGTWEVSLDGEAVAGGELAKRPLAPRQRCRRVLRWRRALTMGAESGGEVHLTLRWHRRVATPWAGRGQLVGWEQFPLQGARVAGGVAGPARDADSGDPVEPGGVETPGGPAQRDDTSQAVSWPATGAAGSVPGDFSPVSFVPSVFRALTDNDGISTGWMRGLAASLARWVDEQGLDRCSWDPATGLLSPAGDVPPVRVRSRLTNPGGEWMRLVVDLELPEELADPPRLGLVWEFPASLETLEWFGDGPADCYPDRRAGALAGRWHSTVTEQYVDYGMPQEHGHHTSMRWVALRTRRGGPGLMVACGGTATAGVRPGFSARHHCDDELWRARHTGELTPMDRVEHTWLAIDVAQRGLGQSSLGPETAPRYRIGAGSHRLDLLFHPLSGARGANGDPAALYRDRPRGPVNGR